jgi:Putative transposase
VPGGGPSLDGTRWVACRPGFFLPVRVLSRLFRRLFLQGLQSGFEAGKLAFFGNLAELADPVTFTRRLDQLRRTEWVVYAKPPFGSSEQVLAYLSRYTHRVAIANSRLISLSGGRVSFAWKDYRQNGKAKVMTLNADEFIRRFLLHTLPDGFHRVRYYGFLANGGRSDGLTLCRQLLAVRNTSTDREAAADCSNDACPSSTCDGPACPYCGGIMRRVGVVPRLCERAQPFSCDTS